MNPKPFFPNPGEPPVNPNPFGEIEEDEDY